MGKTIKNIGFYGDGRRCSQRWDAFSPAIVLKCSDQHLPRLLQQDNTLPNVPGCACVFNSPLAARAG
jgi:hypothetical protein